MIVREVIDDMERRIKYDPLVEEYPWGIYLHQNGRDIFEKGFRNWVDADKWVMIAKGRYFNSFK